MNLIGPRFDVVADYFAICLVLLTVLYLGWQVGRNWLW